MTINKFIHSPLVTIFSFWEKVLQKDLRIKTNAASFEPMAHLTHLWQVELKGAKLMEQVKTWVEKAPTESPGGKNKGTAIFSPYVLDPWSFFWFFFSVLSTFFSDVIKGDIHRKPWRNLKKLTKSNLVSSFLEFLFTSDLVMFATLVPSCFFGPSTKASGKSGFQRMLVGWFNLYVYYPLWIELTNETLQWNKYHRIRRFFGWLKNCCFTKPFKPLIHQRKDYPWFFCGPHLVEIPARNDRGHHALFGPSTCSRHSEWVLSMWKMFLQRGLIWAVPSG